MVKTITAAEAVRLDAALPMTLYRVLADVVNLTQMRNHESEKEKPMNVIIPFTPYRVNVQIGKRIEAVSLVPNGTIKRMAYVRGPYIPMLLRKAKAEMYGAGFMATLAGRATMPKEGPLRVSVTIRTRTRAKKDRDGALAGLKAAFDGVAAALDVDDARFTFGDVVFEKVARGESESTQICVTCD